MKLSTSLPISPDLIGYGEKMVKHLILFLLFCCIMADHTFDGRIPSGSSKFDRASDTNVMPSVSRSKKSDIQILLKFTSYVMSLD